MTRITYIEHDGTEHTVEATDGASLMQSAVDNLVPGILADCGGSCSCATCHGYIDPAFIARTGAAGDEERSILEGALEVEPNSRLTCQIVVSAALDGLIVRLPKSQL